MVSIELMVGYLLMRVLICVLSFGMFVGRLFVSLLFCEISGGMVISFNSISVRIISSMVRVLVVGCGI